MPAADSLDLPTGSRHSLVPSTSLAHPTVQAILVSSVEFPHWDDAHPLTPACLGKKEQLSKRRNDEVTGKERR